MKSAMMKSSKSKVKLPLAVPTIPYEVVARYPHDPKAVTEGLVLFNGELFESTGGDKKQLPLSSLRRVELKTGDPLEIRPVNQDYFAEGVTIFQGRIFQLTDFSKLALIYPLKNLRDSPKKLDYKGWKRGWGLTHDDKYLILSDSTDQIHFVDPNTFQIVRTIHVNDGTSAVEKLNELEYVNGFIYANLYPTSLVLRIDPQDGKILGAIDLSSILPHALSVPNGIAHDAKSGHLFVTGKRWPTLLEIRLLDKATSSPRNVSISSRFSSSNKIGKTTIRLSNQKTKGAINMATKKKTKSSSKAKSRTVDRRQADPPVIVGGGGSVIVYFKSPPTIIPDADKPAGHPLIDYVWYRLPGNIKKVSSHDGQNPGTKNHDVKDHTKFWVQFDV